MLRGINVSGHKVIKMERLREAFESLGFRNVKTYLQSGNVVFEAGKNSPDTFSERIGKMIWRDFGFAVPVLLRTSKEMERIIHQNPFFKKAGIDDSKLHVTFLSGAAPNTAKNLGALVVKPEQFHINAREIYLYCPNGYGRGQLQHGH